MLIWAQLQTFYCTDLGQGLKWWLGMISLQDLMQPKLAPAKPTLAHIGIIGANIPALGGQDRRGSVH